ncbi:hypothetical protein [Prescottella equi]|uniref:hypothetical protein n=1 Tax=Rhodococcus hoagii TaxID=43767 RepID=UPI002742639F|nr:hypothetical protein [Prescottella equi]MDP8017647.1 hypothetical protein [Prescottella equi]
MPLWFQFVGGILVFVGTFQQAMEARRGYLSFEESVLAPSGELLDEHLQRSLQSTPWWRTVQQTRRTKAEFYRELWTPQDFREWSRFKRQMSNWMLLSMGALLGIAAIVWTWTFE